MDYNILQHVNATSSHDILFIKPSKPASSLKHFCPAGTYSNLVKQAKSKQKILDKMEAAGLTPPVQHESTFHFQFPDTDKLPPPVLPFQGVSFSYSGEDKDTLYRVLLSSATCCLVLST